MHSDRTSSYWSPHHAAPSSNHTRRCGIAFEEFEVDAFEENEEFEDEVEEDSDEDAEEKKDI